MLNITVIQPPYYIGEEPDRQIREFLIRELKRAPEGGLIVLPEYSNAGGTSDMQQEIRALPWAEEMLQTAAQVAREKSAYVAINVLQERSAQRKNSTYLFDKAGKTAFIYDKVHLPPSELALGVVRGNGSCLCQLDGIRLGFMTCYDVYFNEQIEYLAAQKPDIIIIPTYQRGGMQRYYPCPGKADCIPLQLFCGESLLQHGRSRTWRLQHDCKSGGKDSGGSWLPDRSNFRRGGSRL